MTNRAALRRRLARPLLGLMDWWPAAFYANAFMLTFLLAQVYWPLTRLVIGAATLVRILLGQSLTAFLMFWSNNAKLGIVAPILQGSKASAILHR